MGIKLNQSLVGSIDNPGISKLLTAVDTFRSEGVGETLPLPQLVVVGDQSSGKSSLLEGLTGLAFPVASDLCTRFATQVVLRRSIDVEASVAVSIIPGPEAQADPEQKQKLEEFQKTFLEADFGPDAFKTILDEAAELMGLPKSGTEDTTSNDFKKRFSDDILRIELSGTDHAHLSFVDVPGLFHNATKYQTLDDARIIRQLIERYVKDRRTIIIAVMDGRNNLANQEVFRMAQAADPEGNRTVGVITKCDALQAGEEAGVLKIARNHAKHLSHGWFLVKNRSAQDILRGVTIDERHFNEASFFKTGPWNKLSKDHLGIKALKDYLGKLLYNHVREEFPEMIKEIEKLLEDAQKQLFDLGPSRDTSIEQRVYLTRLANKYQDTVTKALNGNYEPDLDVLKLRAHLQRLSEDFAKSMHNKGHKRQFKSVNDEMDSERADRGTHSDEVGDDIYHWIEDVYVQCRGPELPGLINPFTLEVLFREQSLDWQRLADEYINQIDGAVKSFNVEGYARSIPEKAVRTKVLARMRPKEIAAGRTARSSLAKLIKEERCAILQTMNNEYTDSLNQARVDRMRNRLSKLHIAHVDIQAISRVAHLSTMQQAVYDIHDVLKAYYGIAVRRFVDNVVRQVVETHFLGGKGPVRLLSTEYIGSLDDQELAAIAGEDDPTCRRRATLKFRIESLEKALGVALEAMC